MCIPEDPRLVASEASSPLRGVTAPYICNSRHCRRCLLDPVCRGRASPPAGAVHQATVFAALAPRPPAAAQASAQGLDFQAADVFFTLCMLQLPQQSMATFFVRSVQSYAELMASLDRMAPLLAVEDRKQVPERRDPPQERAASFDGLTERCHEDMSSVNTQQQEVRTGFSSLCACLRVFLICNGCYCCRYTAVGRIMADHFELCLHIFSSSRGYHQVRTLKVAGGIAMHCR